MADDELIPEEAAQTVDTDISTKGTEEDPYTREEAIAAGIDVDAAEASAETVEEPSADETTS